MNTKPRKICKTLEALKFILKKENIIIITDM